MIFILCIGILGAFFLQHYLFGRYWDQGLSIHINFNEMDAYEGEESFLCEEITNEGFLPLPALEVQFAINRNLIFSGEANINTNITDQSYKRDIFSMLPKQKIIRKLSFKCKKRGFYCITKSTVTGYNFFFKATRINEYKHSTEFHVLPAPVDSNKIHFLFQHINGFIHARNRLYPDPFEFSGIREYTPYDSMKHINWKASARNQGLLVNQFDSTTSTTIYIFLDIEDRKILKEEDLVEESIRIAAAVSAKIIQSGLKMYLFCNSGYSFSANAGTSSLTKLQYGLAEIDTSVSKCSILSEIEKANAAAPSDALFILISKNTELSSPLSKFLSVQFKPLWIIPYYSNQDPVMSSLSHADIYHWEVSP